MSDYSFDRGYQDWHATFLCDENSFSYEMMSRMNVQIEEIIKMAKKIYPGAVVDKILFERRGDTTTRVLILGRAPWTDRSVPMASMPIHL